MQEQAPPTVAEDTEPTVTDVQADGDGDAAETQPDSIDSLLERYDPEQLLSNPKLSAIVQERTKAEAQKAEDRARNRMLAESRRKYGDPNLVREQARAILKESGLDELTRSQEDRLNTLVATFEQQAAQKVAGEIPGVFFGNYKLPQDVLEAYQDRIAEADYDGAFQALVDGAVSLKTSTIESEFEKRVESEVKKRVDAELKSSGTKGVQLPAGSRGQPASSVGRALTTAEIDALPASVWRKLPDEVKDEIKANVVAADKERGAQTVDLPRLQQLASLAK